MKEAAASSTSVREDEETPSTRCHCPPVYTNMQHRDSLPSPSEVLLNGAKGSWQRISDTRVSE